MNLTKDCIDFKLFSKHASRVVLAIFENAKDTEPLAQFEMARGEGDIWKTSVKKYALIEPLYYGYYVFGNESWFHPETLAYDPYSLEIVDGKSVFFQHEQIPVAPLAPRDFANEIIGEVHIKDLTANVDGVETGTFLGASKMAQMLKNFGITMVEFLPLNEFDSQYDGGNYWGYMPQSYFALKRDYGTVEEFQQMINVFHKQGIKVCMDVVYNHTAIDSSLKLIDNKSYYKIDEWGNYSENSCCKNDLNCANHAVQNMIADSVAHFAKLGVDAFRFDLAAALLDTSEGFLATYKPENSLAQKLPRMLIERGVKVCPVGEVTEGINLIAEPWTCAGENAYQIGKFPKKYWYEWNDVARKTLRANSLRPEDCDPLGLKNLIEGSPQIYPGITRSINYIASHDGLTLNDLNSYYVEGWEISGDCYGDFDAQENAIKKQIALLMLSSGTPMLGIGDLIAHTKKGHHNTYNLDSEINYLDFSKINSDGREKRIFDFWMKMLAFRCNYIPQNMERVYLNEYAQTPNDDFWHNKGVNFFAYKGFRGDKTIFVASSKSDYETRITLPKTAQNKTWQLYCSTSNRSSGQYINPPHGLLIFVEQ